MNAYSVIEDWETAPFDGGFDELAALGSRGFDGAVEAAGTWLFFRSGDPIAVVSDLDSTPQPGDIDAFEDASGRQHEAPSSVAATLAAMLALDGDVRGEYFTDDTPLSAVHDTLSDGGFTGYIELSENVLSGDYYYVYVGGEVDHVGFVGSSQRLYGEEAQTRAENEIGIYAVVAVSFPDLELPGPEPESEPEPEPEAESKSGADAEPEPVPAAKPGPDPEADPDSDVDPDAEASADETPPPVDDVADEPTDDGRAPETDRVAANADPESGVGSTEGTAADPGHRSNSVSAHDAGSANPRGRDDREIDAPDAQSASDGSVAAGSSLAPSERDPNGGGGEPVGIGGLATRQVPSLDPERSSHTESNGSDTDRRRSIEPSRTVRRSSSESDERTSNADAIAGASESAGRARGSYEERIDEYEARIEELESELADGESKIESLEAELEAVRNERDELRARLEATGANGSPAGDSLLAEDALEGTSLFVRERTRGEATLEDGHDGTEDRQAVAENLRIEYHTTFDSTDATVEDEPFEPWLRSSPPYAFAEWLVTELLFEIRSTDTQEGLGPLYDALPAIDRIGFGETVSIEPEGGTEAGDRDRAERESVRFDIVARDKKGNPLVVAHFDQRREPTRADTIGPFVTACSNVCEEKGTLAAGVVVTSSYFEADAMSATEEATSTSLLSRSKHRSYVKLSRSSGFHLCLVEARDDTFNLTVPEL